jgi:hypothetical protein
MLTRYDPWVNLLRNTVACFAAGIGGADAVTVVPHDAAATPGSRPAWPGGWPATPKRCSPTSRTWLG